MRVNNRHRYPNHRAKLCRIRRHSLISKVVPTAFRMCLEACRKRSRDKHSHRQLLESTNQSFLLGISKSHGCHQVPHIMETHAKRSQLRKGEGRRLTPRCSRLRVFLACFKMNQAIKRTLPIRIMQPLQVTIRQERRCREERFHTGTKPR